MPAKTLDIVIEQGATFDLDFIWADSVTDAGGVTTQVPKDLTGCTARMQVRVGYNKDILLEATTQNGGITLGSGGQVAITLSATLTDTAPLLGDRVRRRAAYDLEVASPGGRVDRVLQGKVAFVPNITRDPVTP